MSIKQPVIVEIASAGDLDDLISRLPEHAGEQLVLSVPEESNALLTASEFSRVMSQAREAGVRLSISTDDSLRQELARMLGWPVAQPLTAEAGGDSAEPPEDAPPIVDQRYFGWSPGLDDQHSTANLATYVPKVVPTPETTGDPSSTGTIVIDTVKPESKPPTRPSNGVGAGRATVRDEPASRERSGPEEQPASERHRSWRRMAVLVAAIATPLLVLALVAGLAAYLLPSATVTLVPAETTIASTLTYGVAMPGTSWDISIDPVTVEHVATVDVTVPASGERFEPDGVAAGTVLFTNPLIQEVTIPGGTALQGANGVTYYTQEAIAIPAADPFGSLSFGSASARIAAGVAGTDGNTDAGTISGQLSNGVFFTNREAITGGTMRRIPVVTEADIAAAEQQAAAALQSRVEPEFMDSLPANMQLVPGTVELGDVDLHVSHTAGQDGGEVFVKGFLGIRGQIFDPESLHERARNEAGRRLAAQAGPDVMILGDTVRIGEAIPIDDTGTSFEIQAYALVRSVIPDQQRDELEERLVGMSRAEAEAMLAAMPNLESYHIDLRSTWLPDRMPELRSRIEVIVARE